MSPYEFIQKSKTAHLEAPRIASLHKADQNFDPTRHVAPVVAHELNNILTIVQGYAERLLLRHGQDADLMPHLKVISEASKRAAAVVRAATPPNANDTFRRQKNSEQVSVAA
jgi:signal transduction histidine kinase